MANRWYQDRATELTMQRIMAGDKKIIIHMPTASGKSHVFKSMIGSSLLKGNKVIFIVKKRELIFQAAKKHLSNFKPSIIMGNESGFNKESSLQVCSIDTLTRRMDNKNFQFLRNFDLIVIDEMHLFAGAKSIEVLEWLNAKFYISLTATPYPIGNKTHTFWESCVQPVSIDRLINEKFLSSMKIYAPFKVDTSAIRQIAGDFHNGDLFEKMSEMKIIGDIIESYKKYGNGKQAILFAVNIKHSIMLTEAFNQIGIPAAHCDAGTSSKGRKLAIEKFEKKQIRILSSVDIFSTGNDLMGVECLIMARPTMSVVLYIQQAGRGCRPYSICGNCGAEYAGNHECYYCGTYKPKYQKPYCTVLDHGNNVDRHGLPTEPRTPALNPLPRKTKSQLLGQEIKIKQCPRCFMYMKPNVQKCDGCGHVFKAKERTIKTEDGELILMDENMYQQKIKERIQNRWAYHSKQRRFKPSSYSPYEKIFQEFGHEAFNHVNVPLSVKKEILSRHIIDNANDRVFT